VSELVFVTDTHPIVWYTTGEHRRLSARALRLFHQAVAGEVAIWVPVVVLWEWSLLIKTGKVVELASLEELVTARFHAQAMPVLELAAEDVLRAHTLRFSADPFDTMIVAMALREDHPLITRDSVIHERQPCPVVWD